MSGPSADAVTLSEPSIDPMALRRVCGSFATGVAVVTSSLHGVPMGLTVNSFTSVSLDPPRVLFCLSTTSPVRVAIHSSGAFAVNILGEGQGDVCRTFATPHTDRFAVTEYGPGVTGAPRLRGVIGALECRVAQTVHSGDHVIVLGDVVLAESLAEGPPLVFFGSRHVYVAERAQAAAQR